MEDSMSVSNNKFVLNVLIRQNTRLKLSYVFDEKFKDQYPSFSTWIDDLLLLGLKSLEAE